MILNCEKFLEKVDNYIYAIQFSITHGINQARFDIISEQKLFKIFVQKVGQDRIRQEAEKYAQYRNLSVLRILCKQVDKEITVPVEYKVMKPPRPRAEVQLIDDHEAQFINDQMDRPGDFEEEDEDEINYVQGGRYNGYRRQSYGNRNRNYGNRNRSGNRGGYQ